MRLCEYRDILGAPRTGIHAYRIPVVDMAAVDVWATLLVAVILFICIGKSRRLWMLPVLALGLYITGEQLHWLFCVPTQAQLLLERIFG